MGQEPPKIIFHRGESCTEFLGQPPKGSCNIAHCHLKLQLRPIYIELWSSSETSSPFNPIPRITDVPLLLSNLQKAIRRQLVRAAARTALELAHADINALARRLTIIAVEDVRPNAHITTCTWIMTALSLKKYTPTQADAIWLVQYAQVLSSDCTRVEPSKCSGPIASLWRRADIRGDSVALALLVRASFGGMTGDILMLLAAAQENQLNCPIFDWPKDEVQRLEIRDILQEAVDFHCQPSLVNELCILYDLSEEEVKHVIWNCSSKLNTRGVDLDPPTPVYEKIAMQLHALQKARITRSCAGASNASRLPVVSG